jgi:tripartite-type tricarboxylate transporter receptor subunit TctC
MAAMYPIILVVNPSLPVHSVRDLIAYAKARPGKVVFGSSGIGGGEHMAAELFCSQAGIKMLHVPYKGSAPAITDLLGGHVQVMFGAAPSIVPHVKSGRLRGLGISSKERFAGMPELVTIGEAGLPGYQANSWTGVVAPAGTPPGIVEKLNEGLNRSLSTPEVKARLLEVGGEAMPGSPLEFGRFISEEQSKWATIIRQNDIRPE